MKTPILASKAQRTRSRFVREIRRELTASGSFTAAQIAARANTSPATFYNHFRSKDQALSAAFATVMEELLALVEQGLNIERLLEVGLSQFCEQWAATCAEFFRSNAVVLQVAQAEAPGSASLRKLFTSHEDTAFTHYRRFVELAQRANLCRAGDPDAMARVLMMANQLWNHPFAQDLDNQSELYRELVRQMHRLLAPEHLT